jgi:hypothetical protein
LNSSASNFSAAAFSAAIFSSSIFSCSNCLIAAFLAADAITDVT